MLRLYASSSRGTNPSKVGLTSCTQIGRRCALRKSSSELGSPLALVAADLSVMLRGPTPSPRVGMAWNQFAPAKQASWWAPRILAASTWCLTDMCVDKVAFAK